MTIARLAARVAFEQPVVVVLVAGCCRRGRGRSRRRRCRRPPIFWSFCSLAKGRRRLATSTLDVFFPSDEIIWIHVGLEGRHLAAVIMVGMRFEHPKLNQHVVAMIELAYQWLFVAPRGPRWSPGSH